MQPATRPRDPDIDRTPPSAGSRTVDDALAALVRSLARHAARAAMRAQLNSGAVSDDNSPR